MLEHDKSGFLCASDDDLAEYPAYLAGNERRRLAIAEAARTRCEELSEPGAIIRGWERLFRFVSREAVPV
jgi:hypothetical protein